MQQRKSGVSDSADKLPLANPRFWRLDGRGCEFRHIGGIHRLAAPKHREPARCGKHRRCCFRHPNLALAALARGGLLAHRENAFPSDVGPQSKEDQTEGIPEGSSLVDPE